MREGNIVNDFNELSSLLQNPQILSMIQNMNVPKNNQNKENCANFNANTSQMMPNLSPLMGNMMNNNSGNLFSIISSLIGNNPNNIQNIIMLINMISQMQNNNNNNIKKKEKKTDE